MSKLIPFLLFCLVLFSCGDSNDDTQATKDKIIMSENPIFVSFEGISGIEISVRKDIQFDIFIPEDSKEWITKVESKDELTGKNSFFLDIKPNISKDGRSAGIIVKDKFSNEF